VINLSVCLSVTLVYCGRMVGWIKMSLGTEVALGPSDIVLDGTQLPHAKGQSSPSPTFRPTSLWHGRPSQQLLPKVWWANEQARIKVGVDPRHCTTGALYLSPAWP